jgi:hypothetical protein
VQRRDNGEARGERRCMATEAYPRAGREERWSGRSAIPSETVQVQIQIQVPENGASLGMQQMAKGSRRVWDVTSEARTATLAP